MRFVFLFIELVKHVKEIFHITKVLGRVIILSANSVSVGICSYGWDISNNSVYLFISYFPIFVDRFSNQTWILLWVDCR